MATTAQRSVDRAELAFAREWNESQGKSNLIGARVVAAAVERDLAGHRIAVASNRIATAPELRSQQS